MQNAPYHCFLTVTCLCCVGELHTLLLLLASIFRRCVLKGNQPHGMSQRALRALSVPFQACGWYNKVSVKYFLWDAVK